MFRKTILAGALVLASGSAIAQAAASAPVPAPALWDTISSFWTAISPAISVPLAIAYSVTWLAAVLKQATPASSPVWVIVRGVIDLIAANVKNAANAPKA